MNNRDAPVGRLFFKIDTEKLNPVPRSLSTTLLGKLTGQLDGNVELARS